MTRAKTVLETLVYLQLNQLARLLAREHFITIKKILAFTKHEKEINVYKSNYPVEPRRMKTDKRVAKRQLRSRRAAEAKQERSFPREGFRNREVTSAKARFSARAVHVGFMVDNVALGQAYHTAASM